MQFVVQFEKEESFRVKGLARQLKKSCRCSRSSYDVAVREAFRTRTGQ